MMRAGSWMWRAAMVAGLLAWVSTARAQDWARKMFDHTTHDFGVIARGAKVEHRFVVENIYEEDAHIKSVSQWYTITISDSPPPYMSTTVTSQTPSITPTLAAAVGLGLLITGIIIGIAVKSKNKS